MHTVELAALKKRVYNHCGLVLEGIAETRLKKAATEQMQLHKCTNLAQYLLLLSRDNQAFEQLINLLTVNETYFFREPQQIDFIVTNLVPKILAHKQPNQPIRILSAGCSSGEEPYTLAIAIREKLGAAVAARVIIDAGDLDTQVLAKARQGVYFDFSFRGVKPELRDKYFTPLAKGYQLLTEVRSAVNFYQLNLLASHLPQQLNNYDLIMFRNVSIYFDLATRKNIHMRLAQLMADNGLVFLSSSETLGNNLGVFELVEDQGLYFFIKGSAYRPLKLGSPEQPQKPTKNPALVAALPTEQPAKQLSSTGVSGVTAATSHPTAPLKQPQSNKPKQIKQLQQLIAEGAYTQALPGLEELLIKQPQAIDALLLKSWVLINTEAFQAAQPLLDQILALEPWCLDALLMQGLSKRWQSKHLAALNWFKKIIYTNPEAWIGHYYAAGAHQKLHQLEAALKAYQSVLRILSTQPAAPIALKWIPLNLAVGDVVYLCQRQQQQLSLSLNKL